MRRTDDEHDQPIKHTCHDCGRTWQDSLPRLVCVNCGSANVVRNHALLHWRAAEADKMTFDRPGL
jgi:Zn finger protein HypA/HybF involved in hydrogenase expression